MKTRKEIAELSAMLAQRSPALGAVNRSHYSPPRCAADALKLARYAAAAETNATNLCNVPDYQDKYDRKRDSITKRAQEIAGAYNLRAECSGDPRGYCLRLFATDGAPVKGNTWGGDESGYGI